MHRSAKHLALALVLSSLACGSKAPRVVEPTPVESTDAGVEVEAEAPKSLFQRLGNKKVFEDVVDSFVENLKVDTSVKQFAKFSGAKLEQYKASWANALCKSAGGDCTSGTEVKDAHKGLKINDKQWDSMVTDYKAALDENKVADTDKEDLVAVFNQFREEVIEVRTPPKK